MNGKQIRNKLVGSEDERAVSPVIGVILMVAITVILAAVIAAFVLDLGDSVEEDPRAAVTIDDSNQSEVDVQVTSIDNADGVVILNESGLVENESGILDSTGATVTVGEGGEFFNESDDEVESFTVLAYLGGEPVEGETLDDEVESSGVINDFEAEGGR